MGGWALFRERTVDEPLQRAYQSFNYVKECRIVRKQDGVNVRLVLAPVDDLRRAYLELEKKGKEVLGRTPFTVEIGDDRTQELNEVYYRAHFVIQEGIATGRFLAMDETLEKMPKPGVARWRVFVDERRVYVQFHDDKGHSLYEIVERAPVSNGRAVDSGSGKL